MSRYLTCSRIDYHVRNVNEIAEIINRQPEPRVGVVEFPKNAPSDDHHEVVQDCDGNEGKPFIVERL
jgi:cystathionine beta-lyase/cystathionine gamma-synthase